MRLIVSGCTRPGENAGTKGYTLIMNNDQIVSLLLEKLNECHIDEETGFSLLQVLNSLEEEIFPIFVGTPLEAKITEMIELCDTVVSTIEEYYE